MVLSLYCSITGSNNLQEGNDFIKDRTYAWIGTSPNSLSEPNAIHRLDSQSKNLTMMEYICQIQHLKRYRRKVGSISLSTKCSLVKLQNSCNTCLLVTAAFCQVPCPSCRIQPSQPTEISTSFLPM